MLGAPELDANLQVEVENNQNNTDLGMPTPPLFHAHERTNFNIYTSKPIETKWASKSFNFMTLVWHTRNFNDQDFFL